MLANPVRAEDAGASGGGSSSSPGAPPSFVSFPSAGAAATTPPANASNRRDEESPGAAGTPGTIVFREKTSPAKLKSVVQTVESELDQGRLADAHLLLTSLYESAEVPADQAREVTRLLDQLAATVIYSRQHLLESPYRVRPGDTLERIAEQYNVPAQLLARINGVRDLQNLSPGKQLKVVRGPFSAVVDLNRLELTLMLQGRYAGRFPVTLDPNRGSVEGTFIVRDKRTFPPISTVQFGTPATTGKCWIDLGNQVSLQSKGDLGDLNRGDARGAICLSDRDMEDVFGILSVGSRVVVQR